jgi:hypothetical protein
MSREPGSGDFLLALKFHPELKREYDRLLQEYKERVNEPGSMAIASRLAKRMHQIEQEVKSHLINVRQRQMARNMINHREELERGRRDMERIEAHQREQRERHSNWEAERRRVEDEHRRRVMEDVRRAAGRPNVDGPRSCIDGACNVMKHGGKKMFC